MESERLNVWEEEEEDKNVNGANWLCYFDALACFSRHQTRHCTKPASQETTGAFKLLPNPHHSSIHPSIHGLGLTDYGVNKKKETKKMMQRIDDTG